MNIKYRIINLFLIFQAFIGFFWNFFGDVNIVSAQSNISASSFLSAIQSQGINTTNLTRSNAISRYDTVRLLSSVECIDCLNPPLWMKQRYTLQRLQQLTSFPSNNFDDLRHPVTLYKGLNYYYCVAYAADQGYVNGYPRASSPYCPGRFCGTANTTMAELIQIIFNTATNYSNVNYNVNRQQINERTSNLSNRDQSLVFDLDDLATIRSSATTCTTSDSCTTLNQDQLTAYAKYCTHNLDICGFTGFSDAPERVRPVAQLNILIKEGIITRAQADQLSSRITQLAPGSQIIDIFAKINTKTQCSFDDDYDKDGIKNPNDNCPYDQNPSQTDTDSDGIGDVCDCDIDGDTITNGLGIVDNFGNIITSKLTQDQSQCPVIDNCIFTPNTNQEDRNNNSIGDRCEDPNLMGLWIDNNASCAIAPATITFNCTYTGNIGNISRTFGQGSTANGCTVSQRYNQAGTYTITATANQGVQASTTIKVSGSEGQQGLILNTNQSLLTPSDTATITAQILGTIDTIEYISAIETKSLPPSQQYRFTPRRPGTYSITAKGYRGTTLVSAAQIIIGVTSTTQRTVGASLTPATLTTPTNTPIRLTTTINGIATSAIKEIKRDFGDGTTATNTNLSLTKIYLQAGPKVITQTITLNDNTQLITMATIVVSGTSDQCLASYMSAIPLVQSVGMPVIYQINPLNLKPEQISKITCDYGDGNIRVFRDRIQANLTQPHVYLKAGRYTAQCTLTLDNGMLLPNSATVTITGRDRCRDTSTYRCDMDQDTIPDICDEDIDGDGINNLMGLILFEQQNCRIDETNTNLPLKQYEHQLAKDGVRIDNCPFNANTDQADDNKDGYGNICQTNEQICILFDGTRYPGPCPIINPKLPALSTIQVKTCTQCPCQYVQGPTDAVRSLLFNPQQTILQVTGNTLSIK